MVWHQWLARKRDPAGCFRAFLHNHYIGLTVFIGIALDYTFRPLAAT
jgi:4-hydroxybenzoate polyprenyltransferase